MRLGDGNGGAQASSPAAHHKHVAGQEIHGSGGHYAAGPAAVKALNRSRPLKLAVSRSRFIREMK